MIVERNDFDLVIAKLSAPGLYSLDTETTGLKWYDKDKLFSIIIGADAMTYYFNFNDDADHNGKYPPESARLPREWICKLQTALDEPNSTWFLHNAKFDMGMLARDGLVPAGKIHCTEAMARLLDSDQKSYSLKNCMLRLQQELGQPVAQKDDGVMAHILKNKLYTDIRIEGKLKPVREMYFNKVPFDIIVPYAEQDAIATRTLGLEQTRKINEISSENPTFHRLAEQEKEITRVCFEMEAAGIRLDRAYTEEQYVKELGKKEQAKKEFKAIAGEELCDSGLALSRIFEKEGVSLPLTEKGNREVNKEVLGDIDHPLADVLLEYRAANKLSGTYFSNYLYYMAEDGCIHPNMRQAGTRTGRFSYWEPNLQNVPKADEDNPEVDSAIVRRCFIPEPDYCLFMPDYDQMEYRLMLDEAGEMGVINLIKEGLDVHTATAEMMGRGVTRKQAKTINFMLLYGGGAAKLAAALDIPLNEAKALKGLYFQQLPHVKRWIYRTIKACEIMGYTENWLGRKYDIDPRWAYKAPNYKIQGGAADICKKAMVLIADKLKGKKSRMRLQVHDELIFTMHKNEIDLCPMIVKIMSSVYEHKHLELTAGPSYSWESWGEKSEGYPVVKTAGESIKRKGTA